MKVQIKISEDVPETFAVIYTPEITKEVQDAASLLQGGNKMIAAADSGRTVILQPEEIYMVRIENEQTIIYCQKKKYQSAKRLYQMEELLGNSFMKISKSVIINLRQIDSVEPSFNGMMSLLLKNGGKDYISRKYLPGLKKYLGL